ncbi:MAG: hypothetical protein AAGI17_08160 [Planctomycetota bacterium]
MRLGYLAPLIVLAPAAAQPAFWDGQVSDPARSRPIPYRVYYDQSASGAQPLILVSHGGTGSFSGYTRASHLGRAFAEGGYVAIYVGHTPSDPGADHRADRPRDVSHLLDRIELGLLPLPPDFNAAIDIDRVGHVGHSYGAYTAHALAGARLRLFPPAEANFRDDRIDAIVPLSPQGADQFGFFDVSAAENSWSAIDVPVCAFIGAVELNGNVTGSLVREGWRTEPFERYTWAGDKYQFVLPGQDHSDLWRTGSPEVEAFVAENARLFFDLYVKGTPVRPADIGFSPMLAGVERRQRSADVDGDGDRDAFDLVEYLRLFDAGSPDAETGGQTPARLDSADIEAVLGLLASGD